MRKYGPSYWAARWGTCDRICMTKSGCVLGAPNLIGRIAPLTAIIDLRNDYQVEAGCCIPHWPRIERLYSADGAGKPVWMMSSSRPGRLDVAAAEIDLWRSALTLMSCGRGSLATAPLGSAAVD